LTWIGTLISRITTLVPCRARIDAAGRSDDIVVHLFTTVSHAKFLVADDGNGVTLAEVLRRLHCVAGRQAFCFGGVEQDSDLVPGPQT
jgi:hypothetical protein